MPASSAANSSRCVGVCLNGGGRSLVQVLCSSGALLCRDRPATGFLPSCACGQCFVVYPVSSGVDYGPSQFFYRLNPPFAWHPQLNAQGRGPSTHAYTHALEAGHHMFIKIQDGKAGGTGWGWSVHGGFCNGATHVEAKDMIPSAQSTSR